MIVIGETYKTNAVSITPDCKEVPAGTEVVIMEIGEIVKCASDYGMIYIDVDKINKD